MNFTVSGDEAAVHAGLPQRHVHYLLLLIFFVAVFNTGDRTILSVMVDDIKGDLSLDDRQMGFVLGFAFSFAHMLFGIPLARIADRVSCRKVVALSLFGWSAATVLVGLSQSYLQLILARIGVGVGESGGSPACHALIATHVEERRRARAMAVMSIGALAGLGLGATYGSWANVQFGWRIAFISAGIPGILLALIFWFTVKEPRQNRPVRDSDRLLVVMRQLLTNPGFVWLTAAASLSTMTTMGRMLWEPTLLRRVYGMETASIGALYFLIAILPAAIGSFASAAWLDRLAAKDQRWYAWMPAIGSAVIIPMACLFYLWPEQQRIGGVPVAFLFRVALSLIGASWGPATMTLAQAIVPRRSRALGAATWTMIANFIGYGFGAYLVGDLSNRLTPFYGDYAIRYALLAMVCLSPIAALFYMLLARAMVSKRPG